MPPATSPARWDGAPRAGTAVSAGTDDWLDDLRRPAGTALLAEAASALARGEELRAGQRLRAEGFAVGLVAAAFGQAELRARAAGKFSRADAMFFTREGLEQASSEASARHRAERFAGRTSLADLCTGIGGDLIALASGGVPVLAVDRDARHLRYAMANAAVYGATAVTPLCADVRDVDLRGVDGVFVDPARRAGGKRLATGACEPSLDWCFALAGTVGAVVVKAAPGLAHDLVPDGWEIEFVADRRDLKESVLHSPSVATGRRRATVLADGRVATLVGDPDDPSDRPVVGAPGAYLYDPSPAVTRAGLVGTLARRLDAWQIDPMIAFLTSDDPRPTPFARLLRIDHSVPFDERSLARLLRSAGVGSVDVRRRGLAGDVDAIRRRLLPPASARSRGGAAVTVVMTRRLDRPWALVCTDPASTDAS